MEGIKWDLEVDALVVGSGAGGMAAALTAREEGLDVLLVEKTDRIGGSTAISGGALWIPLNAQSEGAGHPDTFEQVWTYLQQTVGAASSDAMKRAYLEAGPRMMDYLVERGHCRWPRAPPRPTIILTVRAPPWADARWIRWSSTAASSARSSASCATRSRNSPCWAA